MEENVPALRINNSTGVAQNQKCTCLKGLVEMICRGLSIQHFRKYLILFPELNISYSPFIDRDKWSSKLTYEWKPSLHMLFIQVNVNLLINVF